MEESQLRAIAQEYHIEVEKFMTFIQRRFPNEHMEYYVRVWASRWKRREAYNCGDDETRGILNLLGY